MILTEGFCIKKFANNLALTGDKGDGLLGVTRWDLVFSALIRKRISIKFCLLDISPDILLTCKSLSDIDLLSTDIIHKAGSHVFQRTGVRERCTSVYQQYQYHCD